MRKFPIKGFNEGVLITIGDGEWNKIQVELFEQIDSQLSFFTRSKVAIDVGEREMGAAQLSKFRDCLLDREIKLFAVLSTSKKTESNASTLGFATRDSILQKKESKLSAAILEGEPGLCIQKTLRSGTKIEFDGHITIYGDVNPGAEINATGSVFVWGKLRGTVNAGSGGAMDAFVCTMGFDPVQLRIADKVLKDNKLIRKLRKKPVKISIDKDDLVLDYWDS